VSSKEQETSPYQTLTFPFQNYDHSFS